MVSSTSKIGRGRREEGGERKRRKNARSSCLLPLRTVSASGLLKERNDALYATERISLKSASPGDCTTFVEMSVRYLRACRTTSGESSKKIVSTLTTWL